MPIVSEGTMIYEKFKTQKNYSIELQSCIESTVQNLLEQETDANKPGMLLGKIQSGKTNTFIGIIALAFDRGYHVAVVLTKGTRALAKQTFQRMDAEFATEIDEDLVKVYDIMSVPELTAYIRDQRLIFIVKKEHQNLKKLRELFFEHYPDMATKQVLIIDDEADFASIGYRRSVEDPDQIEYKVLAQLINKFRSDLSRKSDFLQVTATPYSLYLQPEQVEMHDTIYKPMRPAFTSLVPLHNQYVGGDFYFEQSEKPNSVASYLHADVSEKEFEVLGKRHERYFTTILESNNLEIFRFALNNFLVGGSIRMIQSDKAGMRRYKCSFLLHTEMARKAHRWQFDLVGAWLLKMHELCEADLSKFIETLKPSYDNLLKSVTLYNGYHPSFQEVMERAKSAIVGGQIALREINSDNDVEALLNRYGQLRLDNPFNIFIGGQILDRGVTIDNLIGFFYGRNPKRFQQDTVLQHSRMYGTRSREDLCVTRFYTSPRIYLAMKAMHEFDSALRQSFEEKRHTQDVVFIHKDRHGRVIPCSPTKIMISNTTTIKPFKRLLPVGIQTKARTTIQKTVTEIDAGLEAFSNGDFSKPFLVELHLVADIIDKIASTYEWNEHYQNTDYEWDTKTFKAAMQYLSSETKDIELKGKIYCLVKLGREVSRFKSDSTFSDAPDDGKTDLLEAKKVASEIPCLILLRQKGAEIPHCWRDAEFWWPVLVAPGNASTSIFSHDFIGE